jgi:hypothetical protein
MLIEHLNRQLLKRDAQWLRRRIAMSPCGPHQRVEHRGAERYMLAFCSNDYLWPTTQRSLPRSPRGRAFDCFG